MVGFTLVAPVANVEVKVPGVIATVVAPVVDQFNVLLEPAVMLGGVAVKELIVGLFEAFTETFTVEVAAPAASVAVSV